MSVFDDFRASVEPDTAKQRRQHFSSRLIAHEAGVDEMVATGGTRPGYQSAHYTYGRLLDAHVSFAAAQLREARERDKPTSLGLLDIDRSVADFDGAINRRRRTGLGSSFARLIGFLRRGRAGDGS